MKNLYKLEEYSGRLPNPKRFPIQGGNVIAVKDRPTAFCDGFMLDLSVKERDKEMLEAGVIRTVDTMDDHITDAMVSELLLSEPEFIYEFYYPAYVLFVPTGNPILVQVKYYRYFRNRYRNCNFYIREEGSKSIAVKVDGRLLGVFMVLFYEQRFLNLIKEERK